MSTVAATNLKNASSSVNNAVTTSGGDLTNAAGVSYMGGSKNLLYNGACQIAQRNTSVASITSGGYYTADRWNSNISTLGTWTQSIENDAPTGSGFRKSLKMLCTTAKSSLSAGDLIRIDQYLEGQNLQHIAKGTASAQQLTLSFWVKSNVTGTYVVELIDQDNGRAVSSTYTISLSATWEKKTITFPADITGGAFDNDNALSMGVVFALAAGTTFTSGTLQTTWNTTTNANRYVGQTNLAASINNYWQITGTQLEIGPVATSFEFEPYETTLRKCQRYTWVWKSSSGNLYKQFAYSVTDTANRGEATIYYPVIMRDTPIVSFSTASNFLVQANGATNLTGTGTSYAQTDNETSRLLVTVASGISIGDRVRIQSNNTADARITFNAEL